MPETSYDEVPYLELTHAETHPDRLATAALLLGMQPASTEQCRVLELGCASGSNLVPMAEALPESTFLGIDISARQISEGRALVEELGLSNLTLRQMDILDVGPELGEFDYVIAHGVYSWVPRPVQDHIFAIARRNLAPHGVAYVSYNAYPGWHTVGVLRDMLLFHAGRIEDPAERGAEGNRLLAWLAGLPEEGRTAFGEMLASYAASLEERLEGLDERRDTYLLHDALAAVNSPVYFAELAERASAAGLQYLAEVDSPLLMPRHLVRQVTEAFGSRAEGVVELEQYVDFLRGRMFRRTLLCHAEARLDRAIGAARLSGLHVASRALRAPDRPDQRPGVVRFSSPNGATLAIDHAPSVTALDLLSAAWPSTIPFDDLVDRALDATPDRAGGGASETLDRHRALISGNLLTAHCYTAQLVELRPRPLDPVAVPSERPRASESARVEAGRGPVVTDAYYQAVRLDEIGRRLIGLLDGTRDRAALRQDPELSGDGTEDEGLERRLRWIARNALLVE